MENVLFGEIKSMSIELRNFNLIYLNYKIAVFNHTYLDINFDSFLM